MKKIAVFSLILLLIAGVTYAAEQASSTEQVKGTESVGNKICQVSGDKIDEKTKVTYEYKGKIYNLCCPICVEEFKKDPEKYIGKIEKEGESKQEHSTHGKHHHHSH